MAMTRVRWTPAAATDLEELHEYLAENYPHLASSTITKLYDSICSSKDNPQRGRPGREEGTRELVCAPLPYVAAYRLKDQTIEVPHIHHTSRQRS